MTDPKSISKNQQYYTDQYGNARPADRDPSVTRSYEASVDISDEFGGDIATDPNVPSEYQEFFSDIPPEAGPNDGQLMDGFNEQVNGSVPPGASPIQWDELSQAEHQVTELIAKLKDDASETVLGEGGESLLSQAKKLERDLEKAKNLPREAQEALVEQAQTFIDETTETLDSATQEFGGEATTITADITTLDEKVEESRIADSSKSDFREQLEELKDDLKEFKIGIKEAKEKLKEIKEAFEDTRPDWPIASILANIPEGNDFHKRDHALNLANKVNEAFDSDDWASVLDVLNMNIGYDTGLPADQGERNGKILNDVVRKFMTGLYNAAGSMEELQELLKLIPEDVRQKMIDKLTYDRGEGAEIQSGDRWSSEGAASIIRQSLGSSGSSTPS